ncbi:MAG: pirin family protein [Rhizomicrobium sp.]|jgi:redox-sensitive bicupin YhaK (pirin superfamily)
MLDIVIDQRRRSLGGFDVGRVLPFAQHRMVGPFVFFDHMGPVDFPKGISRDVDVRPHPHIGLSTVTYLFDGEIMHRDSVGSEQAIRQAEVNWMVAGRGITHSERFEKARAEGGRTHGIQSWVALPQEDEETAPGFTHYGRSDLPLVDESGCSLRILAGDAYGVTSEVTTHSPMFYVHANLSSGRTLSLPDNYAERAVFVVSGTVESDGQTFHPGQMAVFAPKIPVTLEAMENATLMLLGGESVGPRFVEWNFVSSSKDRIEQAKADWRAGRMKLPDLDHGEFIPLPPDPPPQPHPMS